MPITRNKTIALFAAGICLVGNVPAMAARFLESTVDDPIVSGKTCDVHQPVSYGSYIYAKPSKYDLVFWPLTSEKWVWHCKQSGFTAFGGDFEITDKERRNIRDYLASAYDGEADVVQRLRLLEGIYELREKNVHFRNLMLRVLARRYQELGYIERANEYRLIAWTGIKELLLTDLELPRKLEYLFIAANYARQAGDRAASDEYLRKLTNTIDQLSLADNDRHENLEGQANFLLKVVADTALITPGGRLEPDQDVRIEEP